MTEDNSIFIGSKPFMNYVTGVVMQFTTKQAETVHVKARGKFISRAVDVSEVAAKRFLDETVETKNIIINSEEFENREGRQVRVSTIEIVLGKRDGMEPKVSQPIKNMPHLGAETAQPMHEESSSAPSEDMSYNDQDAGYGDQQETDHLM